MYQKQGYIAEQRVADWLIGRRYRIVARNWRNRFAEIDIIAAKKRDLIFIEVKYRRDEAAGAGYEYVTRAKLQQMEYATKLYSLENSIMPRIQPLLAVASVSGQDYEKIELIMVDSD